MRLGPQISPLRPVFRERKRTGSVDVGNTPPTPIIPPSILYDSVVLDDIGAMWYCIFDRTTMESPIWFTYAQAIAQDEYNTGWGPFYVEGWTDGYAGMEWPSFAAGIADDARFHLGPYWAAAWWAQSAQPAYDTLVDTVIGAMWYSTLDTQIPSTAGPLPDWEDWLTVQAGDYRSESAWGTWWFNAWYAESGHAPIDYQDAIDNYNLGVMWFSPLDELTTVNSLPVGGTITTPGDGFRYHTFTSSDAFWTMSPTGLTVDILLVGGGGSGGRATTNASGGGGGGGEVLVLTGVPLTDGGLVTVGSGGANPGLGAQGNDGGPSSFAGFTAAGGSGGGAPAVSSGAGRSSGGSGGGGAASTTVSGVGGAGSTGGNAGGDGAAAATASQRRAGGGGGAGGAGTSGVANGQVGNGGPGIEWPAGSGQFYGGGGGGSTGAGTSAGGTGGGGGAGTGTGTNGTANRGGGGGGAGGTSNAGAGGSGIVIIRYPFP